METFKEQLRLFDITPVGPIKLKDEQYPLKVYIINITNQDLTSATLDRNLSAFAFK